MLAQVARETSELPNAGMQSRADQAALLTLLARLVDARVAVEVGTFTGYGAICIARGLAERRPAHVPRGVAHEYAEIARAQPRAGGLARPRDDRGRPGARVARTHARVPQIDFAYVDADKPGYPAYYEALVPRLRPGGVLVLDNTLLGERVLDPQDDRSRHDGRAERADRGRRARRVGAARPRRTA